MKYHVLPKSCAHVLARRAHICMYVFSRARLEHLMAQSLSTPRTSPYRKKGDDCERTLRAPLNPGNPFASPLIHTAPTLSPSTARLVYFG